VKKRRYQRHVRAICCCGANRPGLSLAYPNNLAPRADDCLITELVRLIYYWLALQAIADELVLPSDRPLWSLICRVQHGQYNH